jgi:acetyl esterase
VREAPSEAALPEELAPEIAALLPRIRDLLEPPARDVGLAEARRRFAVLLRRGLAGAPEVPTEDVALDGGPTVRVHRPDGHSGATVVYLHGGGWTLGDPDAYDGLTRRIADRVGAVVVSVGYRLAPGHPFPAAVDDALAATRWALAEAPSLGGDPRSVAVAGDSGGGNLAAVVCQQLRDAGGARPSAALLLYPNVARGADQPSVRRFGGLPFLSLSDMGWYTRQYVPRGVDLGDPRISPLEGRLSALPPTLVVTAGVDPLHDSGRRYAEAIRAHGGAAEWLDVPGLPHGFAHLVALAPAADAAVTRVLARFRAVLRDGL